jgi:hypothetical protein
MALVGCGGNEATFSSVPSGDLNVKVEKSTTADADGNTGGIGALTDRGEVSDAEAGEAFEKLANPDAEQSAATSIETAGASTDAKTADASPAGDEPTIAGADTEGATSSHGNSHGKEIAANAGKKGESEESASEDSSSKETSDKISSEELAACAKLQGSKDKGIKVLGASDKETIKSDEITAIKLVGNHPAQVLNYVGEDIVAETDKTTQMAGLCIFAAGNQANLTINLSKIALGRLVFVGRGNQPVVHVNVDAKSELTKAFADLRGNNALLGITVEAGGKFDCASAYIHTKGKKGSFECNIK